jgi:hypothetical protein
MPINFKYLARSACKVKPLVIETIPDSTEELLSLLLKSCRFLGPYECPVWGHGELAYTNPFTGKCWKIQASIRRIGEHECEGRNWKVKGVGYKGLGQPNYVQREFTGDVNGAFKHWLRLCLAP